MKTIEAYVEVSAIDLIQELPNFKPVFMYINDDASVTFCEWGKLVFGNIQIKFYVKK